MLINLPYNRPEKKKSNGIGGLFKKNKEAEEKELTDSELTKDYLYNAIISTYPRMKGQMRRVFGRIQRAVDEAINTGKDEIELDDAGKELIRKSFETAEFSAHLSKYVIVLEDEIAKL